MASQTKDPREAALAAALAEKPAFHAAVPRLAWPGADLTSSQLGPRIELSADEFGIVRPTGPDAVRLADALGLPVLRSANQASPTPPETEPETEPTPAAAAPADEEET